MSITGNGTKFNPYANFSNSEFNNVTKGFTGELFFKGNYHHSIIFDTLRTRWVETQFGGIPTNQAVSSNSQHQNSHPLFDYQQDFPYDLEFF